ncbi:T9SS type A sorting domain-containing protein [candidate division KSB1 bacterium]|nr:T9SS type A sorting domain-containing protein [candidate division KSB1 bacterium]
MTANDGIESNAFGCSVAIEGNTTVIGAPCHDPQNAPGSVYIFQQNNGQWTQQKKLQDSDGLADDHFGSSVALHKNIVVVGKPNNPSSGAVHIYKLDGTGCREIRKIKKDTPRIYYGMSVAISSKFAIIGSLEFATVLDLFIPGNLKVSNGTESNSIKLQWDSPILEIEGLKIHRNGEVIDTQSPVMISYRDQDQILIPGKIYSYGVSAYNTVMGESRINTAQGWSATNGRIDGEVNTLVGAGVINVAITVAPNDTTIDNCLEFDGGDDFVQCGMTGLIDIADEMTIEAWIKVLSSFPAGSRIGSIIGNYPHSANFNLEGYTNGQLRFWWNNGELDIKTTDFDMRDGTWHHVAVSRDAKANEIILYADGEKKRVSSAGSNANIKWPLRIGNDFRGGGGLPFSGRIDEVRIWNVARDSSAIRADMNRILNGSEKDLVAYYTFDDSSRSSGAIAADYTIGGGHHGTIYGAQWIKDTTNVRYRTLTDGNGDYSLRKIYYGEEQEFTVEPFKSEHGFKPPFRTKILDINSTTLFGVNFTDTTSFTAFGRIVQILGGDTCYVKDVEISMNNLFTGAKTDADGKFHVAIGHPGTYTFKPTYEDHTFEPATITWTIWSDTSGINFRDTQMHTLSGHVLAGCGYYIGQADLRITNTDYPPAGFDTTITTEQNTGAFEIVLPAREYAIQFVDFQPADDPPIVNRDEVLNYLEKIDSAVDLTLSDQTKEFVYRKKPEVLVTGFYDFGKCEDSPFYQVPILEQGILYHLKINVSDRFADQYCPVDTGYVIIQDEVGFDASTDTVAIDSGFVRYDLRAGYPNLHGSNDDDPKFHPFQKRFRIVAHVEEQVTDTTIWVLVTGNQPREQTFATVSPELPMMILRDPPGDASYSFLSKGTVTETSARFWASTNISQNLWGALKVGHKFTTGFCYEVETEIWGQIKSSLEVGAKIQGQTEFGLTITAMETFDTSGDDVFIGESGDVFVGAALNIIYALTDVLSYVDGDSCKVVKSQAVIIGSDGFATTFMYTDDHIRNVLVPQLNQLRTIYEKAGSDSALIYANQIDVWQQTLALNHKQKVSARLIENRSFSSGATFESTQEVATKLSAGIEFSVYLEESVAAEAGLNIAGVGFSGGVETKWRFDIGTSLSAGITTSRKTGFVLNDDDLGDFFSVDIKADEVYGTPVFSLVSGRSSCPWEPGTQPRDGVDLEIAGDVTQYDVPPGSPAVFTLLLGNTSQSDETREYHLRVIQGTNPDAAIIKVGGMLVAGHLSYYIDPGARQEATLTVERGPRAYDYENIQIMLYPPCQYAMWQKNRPIMIADTVAISVYFESTCSDVVLKLPENNWLVDQLGGNNLDFMISDYDLNNQNLQSIKLQYRPSGGNWTTTFIKQKAQISTATIESSWDISNLSNDRYELRAAAECTEGVDYSNISAGIIDRNSLLVVGTEPADGVLHSGDEICVHFSDTIDTSTVAGNITLETVEEATVLDISVTCSDNTLIIHTEKSLTEYAGKYLTATVCGLKSMSECVQRKTASWTFMVSEDYTPVVADPTASIPEDFFLKQNYPNPFNPTTTIEYGVPAVEHVRLSLYNLLGQRVKVLVDRAHQPGNYTAILTIKDGDLTTGVYYYLMQAGEFHDLKKMVLIK